MFINNLGHMAKMAVMPIHGKLLRTDFNETWHVASVTRVLQYIYNLWPWDDLDIFYGKVNMGRLCILMGENC